jgi:hypothetical protein
MITFGATKKPTSTATKTGGVGNVPGMKLPQPTKPLTQWGGASGWQIGQAPPTFTPQTPNFSPAAAGSGPPPTAAGTGVPGDPRDPTYWTEVAQIHQTFGTNLAGYDLQEKQGQTKLTNALDSYDKQQPIDTSNARGSYNNSGLFYSSRLGQAETGITEKYDTARTDAKAGFAGLHDSLAILRNDNQNKYGTGPNGELTGTAYLNALNAGTGRATASDTALANQNILAALLNPSGGGGGAATPDATPGPALTPEQGNKANWVTTTYTNSNGHPVRVYGDGRKEVKVGGIWKPV